MKGIFEKLSVKQVMIARMVGQDCKNTEIATEFVNMSPDAISWHLRQIYKILGITGDNRRSQLKDLIN